MKKAEAETAIRSLCHTWQEESGLPLPPSMHDYSFSDFTTWLSKKGYDHYLKFRSEDGPQEAAERWFIQEMKISWRY